MPAGKLQQLFSLQGNQLGGGAGGAGSAGKSAGRKREGNWTRAAAKAQQQQAELSPRCAPTSTASWDREGLDPPTATPQREKHKSDCWEFILTLWPWLWLGSSTNQLLQLLMASTAWQQSLPECGAPDFSAYWLTPGPKDRQTFKEPRGLSGPEAGDEEGTQLPAHQKVSVTFFPLKVIGQTGTGIQKAISAALASGKSHENPDVDRWQFPLRKDFHSCSHSQG